MERKVEGSVSVSPSTLSTLAGVTDNSQGSKVEVVPAIPANSTLPDHVTTPSNPTKLPVQPKMAIKMSPELTQFLKLEAERLKLQREQLKVKMKYEKDAEKKAKAEERERLKRERQEKKELLEKQREEKRLAKEKVQQEKIQAKKLKEKEQQLLAADKLKKEQLSQKFFKNFFNINKLSNMSTQKDKEVQHVKTTTLNQSQMESLENHLLDQTAVSNYLCSCKGRQLKCNRRSNVNDSLELCIVDPNKLHLKFKFLKFHDNHRPPYHGTWRRKSSLISPRNPFKRDESQLDYDCDSDEEWEEEEPGETLSHSEEEMESGGEEEEDEDGFFVPHGYLSDGEGDMSDGEGGGKSSDKLSAKAKAWEAEFSRKCSQPLVPVKMGVVWTLATPPDESTDSIRLFLSKFAAVSLVPLPIITQTCPTNQSHLTLPDDVLKELVRLVHTSKDGINKLVDKFQRHLKLKPDFSQQMSNKKIKEVIVSIATRETRPLASGSTWKVNEDVLKRLGMSPNKIIPLDITVDALTPNSANKKGVKRCHGNTTPTNMKSLHFFLKPSPKHEVTRCLETSNSEKKMKLELSSSPVLLDLTIDKENQDFVANSGNCHGNMDHTLLTSTEQIDCKEQLIANCEVDDRCHSNDDTISMN